MKNISKIIKGVLLTALLLGLFNLNIQPMAKSTAAKLASVSSIGYSDYLQTPTFAADAPTPDAPTSNTAAGDTTPFSIADILKTIAKASYYVDTIFNPLIHYLTFNIGTFLGNDYIFAGEMGTMLHSIWVVSRNIVNIVFVLILLFLALRHIFSEEEGTDLKKVLPKFVIMLIAINFSWLAGKLVLDAANVATNVVFAVPSGVATLDQDVIAKQDCTISSTGRPSGLCIPTKVFYPGDTRDIVHKMDADCKDVEKQYQDTYTGETATKLGEDGNKSVEVVNPKGPVYQKATFCWNKMDLGKYNQNNASYYLSYSMAKVQDLTQANTGYSISKVAIGTLFALVIQVVYLIAMGALYIALIIRVAMMWILMAFSPFIVLLMYMEEAKIGGGDEAKEYLGIKAFTTWAFAPTKVAAVWTIGFIMITTGQSMSKDFFVKLNAQGGISSQVFSIKTLFMGMDSIQEFIWLLMTIGVIWMGTFAILTKLNVGTSIFNSINDFGKTMAKEVGGAYKWAPILPMYTPEGKKMVGIGSLSPVKQIQALRQKYEGGYSPTDKFDKGSQNLKNMGANQKEEILVALKAENETEVFNKIRAAAKTVDARMLKDPAGERLFREMITKSGVFEAKEVDQIVNLSLKYAKGLPDTAPAPQVASTAAATSTAGAGGAPTPPTLAPAPTPPGTAPVQGTANNPPATPPPATPPRTASLTEEELKKAGVKKQDEEEERAA